MPFKAVIKYMHICNCYIFLMNCSFDYYEISFFISGNTPWLEVYFII